MQEVGRGCRQDKQEEEEVVEEPLDVVSGCRVPEGTGAFFGKLVTMVPEEHQITPVGMAVLRESNYLGVHLFVPVEVVAEALRLSV